MEQPQLFRGGLAADDRGVLRSIEGADFSRVKRLYAMENFSSETIRAFHGHRKEAKYVTVVCGSALVAAAPLDVAPTTIPSPLQRFVLSAHSPALLYVPAGYMNGFRALEAHTRILFFSTATVEESKADDYRFPPEYWGKSVWTVENR